jgi:membrane-anchored mycosin MYCP
VLTAVLTAGLATGSTTGLTAGPVLPAAPALAVPPLAGENGCVRDVADPGQPMPDERPSKAVSTQLRLDEAHRVSRGQGVGVAVVDSGVDTGTGALDVRGGLSVGGARGGRPEDAHGTIVAGLVAGDDQKRGIVGIAPEAHVVPIRVLDGDAEVVDEGLRLEAANLATGIREAIKLRDSQNVRVINLSLVLDAPSRAVADAIAAAQKQGILVVAAVGNRPPDETGTGPADPYKVGEKQVRFPATEKGVLGVTALDAGGDLDPTFVWTGPGTDVSAPAVKALSVTVGGAACGIVDVASSWATAQVSGLAALLFAQDKKLTPAQVSTRIVATARGAINDSALDGHGMIQPLEALTADLEIARDGTLRRAPAYTAPRAEVKTPEPPRDIAEESRQTMLWWAIGAGGALLLGLLLRPLTARRRT